MSFFISFEGGEGSGKTTQAEILARRLEKAGASALLVREPGTTALGVYLRDWLKRERRKGEAISGFAELFLFEAARAELFAKVIRPALARDKVIIADRFADSTTAYQGYGRRLSLESIDLVNRIATSGTKPDLTCLLDCPPEEGLMRVGEAQMALALDPTTVPGPSRVDQEGTRRFEQESLDFHQRVRAGYRTMAEREPDRWFVLDAGRPAEEIGDAVWKCVEQRLWRDASAHSAGDGASPALSPGEVEGHPATESPT